MSRQLARGRPELVSAAFNVEGRSARRRRISAAKTAAPRHVRQIAVEAAPAATARLGRVTCQPPRSERAVTAVLSGAPGMIMICCTGIILGPCAAFVIFLALSWKKVHVRGTRRRLDARPRSPPRSRCRELRREALNNHVREVERARRPPSRGQDMPSTPAGP